MIVREGEYFLPAFPDVFGDRAPAALHDQRARGAHVSPRGCAVESKVHVTAGTQQRVEHAQTPPWIAQVMQHPARLDQIEAPPDASELENIGLCKFYVANPKLARFARGVAEAGQAEIDRKHVGADKSLRSFNSMLSGATAGDQDIERCTLVGYRDRRLRKLVAQIPRHAGGLPDRRRLEPARIRRFLILLANRNGD